MTAGKAGIPIQKNRVLEVMVANGERIISPVYYKHLLLLIQEISVCTDFYLFKLEWV